MCRVLMLCSPSMWTALIVSALVLRTPTFAYDLSPSSFVVTSPNPVNYDVNTTVTITFSVTVANNGAFDGNVTDFGDLRVHLYVSDSVQLETAVHFTKINVQLHSVPDLTGVIDNGEDLEISDATADVVLSRVHCPLENYVCVEIVLGDNDTVSENNDRCIKFGPQSEGKAGEKQCPESALQTDVDSGVNVVLQSLSILLWPSKSVEYRNDVSDIVNEYCRTHESECCGNVSVSNNTVDITGPGDVLVAGGYPRRFRYSLSILTYVMVRSDNTFCPTSSDFRLSQDTLLSALQDGMGDFTEPVQEVRLGELFTEDEVTTPSPTTAAPRGDKKLLLRDWQIGVCVFAILLVVVGVGTLVYLVMPTNDPEYYVEVDPSSAVRQAERPGKNRESRFGIDNGGAADFETLEIADRGADSAVGPGASTFETEHRL